MKLIKWKWFKTTQAMTLPFGIVLIRPDKFYNKEFKLIDTQYLGKSNQILYIFRDKDNGKVYTSDQSIQVYNEQILLDLGLSITIQQTAFPGDLNNSINKRKNRYYCPWL